MPQTMRAERFHADAKKVVVEDIPIPEPGPGEVLVKVHYLSLDPYQRGRMRDAASYAAAIGLGEVMTGGTVGEVVKSNHPGFAVGDIVEDRLGWQTSRTIHEPRLGCGMPRS